MSSALNTTRARAIFWTFVAIDAGLWALAFSWKPPRVISAPIVAVNIWPGAESMIAARESGRVSSREIHFVETSWSRWAMRAFGNRAIDVSVLALSEALLMRDLGYPFRIVMAVDESRGADAIVARPGIGSVPELKGKRVAVEIRSVGHYLLGRALQEAGMSFRDVEMVPVVLPEIETAFSELGVDAVVAAEPWLSRILGKEGRAIFDSSDLPGEILRVLIARDDAIESSPDALRKLLDSHFELSEPASWSREVKAGILRREGLTGEELERALEKIRSFAREDQASLLSGESARLKKSLELVALKMREMELLSGERNPIPEIDDRFVKP